MQIIVPQQAVCFFDQATGQTHNAKPMAGAQEAPEWIRSTETFRHAAKGGTVVEIRAVVIPEDVEPDEAVSGETEKGEPSAKSRKKQ